MKKEDREGFAEYKELIATVKAGRKKWIVKPDYVVLDRRTFNEFASANIIVRQTCATFDPPLGYLYQESPNEYLLKSSEIKDKCIPIRDGDMLVIKGKDAA